MTPFLIPEISCNETSNDLPKIINIAEICGMTPAQVCGITENIFLNPVTILTSNDCGLRCASPGQCRRGSQLFPSRFRRSTWPKIFI